MIHIIVGTRPNFVKAAPLCRAMTTIGLDFDLIHTGQHFDDNMSGVFFRDLGLPPLLDNLDHYGPAGFGPGHMGRKTTCGQIAAIIEILEEVFEGHRPNMIVVFGDVNSSLAAAIVANKMCIPLAHVEAGERSFDRTMPEEINRVLIDEMANLLFCSSQESVLNLNDRHIEHYPGQAQKVFRVGNIMADQLIHTLDRLPMDTGSDEKYAVLTMHRQAGVDDRCALVSGLRAAGRVAARLPVIFPVHPRTRRRIIEFDLTSLLAPLETIDPLGYVEFVKLVRDAAFVMTDSGGLQVETSVMNVPCLTLRSRTEWADTLSLGTNRLVGSNGDFLLEQVDLILANKWKVRQTNPDWDGRAAERIATILKKECHHVHQAV